MSEERASDTSLPITHRYDHDREHDWEPLNRLADLATRAGHPVAADYFMWMGAADFADGRTVHSYKHVDTRQYLHLDESGHAYRFLSRAEGGRYVLCRDPREAIDRAIRFAPHR